MYGIYNVQRTICTTIYTVIEWDSDIERKTFPKAIMFISMENP